MAASLSIRTDDRSLLEVAVRNLNQRPDPLYPGLIRPREGPSDLPLDFPELLLQPERSLRDYRSQTLNPTDPLFSELNRLIALLEDGDEVKTAYLSYIESVCRAEGKSRWKLLKGEVRLVAQLPSEAVCLLIPRKIGKEIVATSSIGELPLFTRSAEEPNIVIQLENLSLDRTPLFFGIASERRPITVEIDSGSGSEPILLGEDKLQKGPQHYPEKDASLLAEPTQDQTASIIETSQSHLEAKNYRLASLTLINASSIVNLSQIEEQFDLIESSFLRDTFGIETLTPSTILHRELLNKVRSNALKAMNSGRPIQEVQRVLGRGYKRLLSALFGECLKLLGAPRSRYALIALEGLSREELFPFSEMRFAILVERTDCIDHFRNISDLLELKIIRLRGLLEPHQSNRSAVVGTPQEVALLLSTSLHNSLLLGDRKLLVAHRKSVARLIRVKEEAFLGLEGLRAYQVRAHSMLKIYLDQLEQVLSRASFNEEELDFESELYRPLENALRSLLLYFGKGHYTTRQGIIELPLTVKDKRAFTQLFDYASSLITRIQFVQCQENEVLVSVDPKMIFSQLSSFYQAISAFIDDLFPYQIQSRTISASSNINSSEESLPVSSDPEGRAYLSFEMAYESGDLVAQVFWLETLAQIRIEKKDYFLAAHLLNGALAIAQGSTTADHSAYLLNQLERVEKLFLWETFQKKSPAAHQGYLLRYRNELCTIRAKLAKGLKKGVAIEIAQELLTQSYQQLLIALINESIDLLGEGYPIGFAVMVLGSMARMETTPYSDIEFVFLIQDSSPAHHLSVFRRSTSETR